MPQSLKNLPNSEVVSVNFPEYTAHVAADKTTFVRNSKPDFVVNTKALVLGKDAEFSSFRWIGSKFTTLVKQSNELREEFRLLHVELKHISTVAAEQVSEHSEQQLRDSCADMIPPWIHNPMAILHDAHSENKSSWCTKLGEIYGFAELDVKKQQIVMGMRLGIFAGRLRDAEFRSWVLAPTSQGVSTVVDLTNRKHYSPVVEEFVASLQTKRKIAIKPLPKRIDIAGFA